MMEQSATVLVVDDEAVILHLVSLSLREKVGCTVLTATNGKDALELLGKCDVQLLLTDVVMPGMNGSELVRRARLIKPELAACFISGFSEEYEARGAGTPFIQKPFDLGHLASVVRTMLAPAESRKGPRLRVPDET
jgi:YesN/AraC family two-component response regulator